MTFSYFSTINSRIEPSNAYSLSDETSFAQHAWMDDTNNTISQKNIIFELRESSRDSTIASGSILIIWTHLRSIESRGFDALKYDVFLGNGINAFPIGPLSLQFLSP